MTRQLRKTRQGGRRIKKTKRGGSRRSRDRRTRKNQRGGSRRSRDRRIRKTRRGGSRFRLSEKERTCDISGDDAKRHEKCKRVNCKDRKLRDSNSRKSKFDKKLRYRVCKARCCEENNGMVDQDKIVRQLISDDGLEKTQSVNAGYGSMPTTQYMSGIYFGEKRRQDQRNNTKNTNNYY